LYEAQKKQVTMRRSHTQTRVSSKVS